MNGHVAKREGAAQKLRHMIESSKDIILCPGVYDGFSARIALSVGFDALYMV
jgi:methylisocitrate lyase